ncbi:MAG: hypothetical protein COW00_19970 [Bdellovibrio sp. CG12_big_fil_rev_8_21_14_0_65_39_13]|nr:MAG: hypothetical protein COW78_02145 [Bdellovibrio sp. CG22_combo_CG10-13_8_21_14_all_39_27]PIQ57651.1 MAG: hypothetical protein COW00_19970 [Bdellovibrio sp. CG12_big_fil_rev_8_21_14_0_65_39_13]PIR35815.1 MAG: hypothetical protein COV37_06350 [Bdellovibrio sp. CG11_big_fil_rev_8_21_14_0_20_39_38]PJB53521.1 MAG: hypothetical protein CO099_06705 [Bdellovibrio sp. CG_4_9_14_3_um_filter_39_7]
MSFFKTLRNYFDAFVPDYKEFMDLGYRATTFNGDFILEKSISHCHIRIHQSIEPFNPVLSSLIDFDLNDNACVVIDVSALNHDLRNSLYQGIKEMFDFSHLRDSYIFLYDKKMELKSVRLPKKLESIEEVFKQVV